MIWRAQTEEIPPDDGEVVVPIELDSDMVDKEQAPGDSTSGPTPPPTAQLDNEPEPVALPDAGARKPAPLADAGPPDAGADAGPSDAGADAGEADAGLPLDGGIAALGPDAGSSGSGAGSKITDPYAVAGALGAALQPDQPNVKVLLATDQIRKEPDGPLFGEMLVSIPQWQEVIGGTGIDPVRDFDHILFSGPQFRDPANVVAYFEYNVPAARMKEAIERVMARSTPPGEWLSGYPFPVASLGKDGYRRAVLLPAKRLLVLLPASAEDQIDRLKSVPPFRKSGESSIVFSLVTPWRAFAGTGFPLPERIARMRLKLTPINSPAGRAADGYTLDVEAEDESAEAATEDAKIVADGLETVRVIPMVFLKDVEIIGKPVFSTDGAMIRAHATVSGTQVEHIVKVVKAWEEKLQKEEGAKEKRKIRRKRLAPAASKASSQPAASASAPP